MQAENVQLKEDRDDNDIYSRKSNLVLKGIPESKDEDDNQCEAVVKTFFKNELKLNDQMVRDMQLVACHRFGQKSYDDVRSTQRPIISFINMNIYLSTINVFSAVYYLSIFKLFHPCLISVLYNVHVL